MIYLAISLAITSIGLLIVAKEIYVDYFKKWK
jgi:hypothetical protein